MLRCQCPSVCPSVCDAIALARYTQFRFQIPIPIYRALRSLCMRASDAGASTELFIVQWSRGKGSSPGRVEGSSRAMLATARPSCDSCQRCYRRYRVSGAQVTLSCPSCGRLPLLSARPAVTFPWMWGAIYKISK